MKFIDLYSRWEDFDWGDEDFDFEEELPIKEIKKDDLKDTVIRI